MAKSLCGGMCLLLLAAAALDAQSAAQSLSADGGPIDLQQLARSMHPVTSSSLNRGVESIVPEGLADLKLESGSMVDIQVFEEPDLNGSFRLDDAGNISIPLAGSVHLGSLALHDAAEAVKSKLISAQILNDPHVTVNIDEYNSLFVGVLGEVNTPGRFPALTAHSLGDVLAMAGGESPLSGGEITIHRRNQPATETEKVVFSQSTKNSTLQNVQINPGDNVTVNRTGIVYVLGAVNRPGGYPMQEFGALSVPQALSLALGTAPQALIGKIRVIRQQPDGSLLEIPGMYKQFREGKADALPLQPQDVVFVPSSLFVNIWKTSASVVGQAGAAVIYTH